MKRGLFITFEGSDGSGKSTQIAFTKDFLQKMGFNYIVTLEPGGTLLGEHIRSLLLEDKYGEVDPMAETLLYAADRAQHVEKVIKPALEDGSFVISDRYVDSSVAYQGFGRGLGKVVKEVNNLATGGLEPDLTIFLEVPPKVSKKRIEGRPLDRLEKEAENFYERVYEGYGSFKGEDRFVTIDGTMSIEEVSKEIEKHLERVLLKYGFRG